MSVLAIAVLSALFVILTKARPAYDAMGFLVWGREALHWNLNLNGAPSWKPLPLLLTAPYALAGLRAQEWLWTFSAVAGAGVAVVLAGRLAYRLSPVVPGRGWARLAGALVASLGVATMAGFVHLTLIANSDPAIVALTLGAINCHVSRRPRAALGLLWLAALGRPEAWPFLFLYALWIWRERPAARRWALAAVVLVPAIWFVVPELSATSWLHASQLALGQATVIHGNKLIGVFDRLRTLSGLSVQLGVLGAIVIGVIRRDRGILYLAGCALLWTAVEVAFALHGYSAVQRYLIEPAALLLVVLGVGVATVLSGRSGPTSWPGLVAVVALLVLSQPYLKETLRTDHGLISQAHTDARVLGRLAAAISAGGGAQRLLACGQPVTTLSYQSTLAWELGVNVGSVAYHPRSWLHRHRPAVVFEPRGDGWIIRVLGPAAGAAACGRSAR